VCNNLTGKTGILLHPQIIEVIISDNQMCGYMTHIHFWGANHKRNQQPIPSQRWLTSIKVEMISYEKVIDAPNYRLILDDFSDSQQFAGLKIPCYSIHEIVAEKFRSLLQRSYAAPRDYYDLWHILRTENINWEMIKAIFQEKLTFKKIPYTGYEDFFEASRIIQVKQAWKNSLQNHIRYVELPDVETVLSELKFICKRNLI
jgi:predicted nucleotidyltransferase component of viral defense system